MTRACVRCGSTAKLHRHHPTMRVGGVYLHPDLTIDLCEQCHRDLHIVMRAAHLERASKATPAVVVGRVGVLLGFLSWPGQPVTLPADVFSGLASALEEVTRELRRTEQVNS